MSSALQCVRIHSICYKAGVRVGLGAQKIGLNVSIKACMGCHEFLMIQSKVFKTLLFFFYFKGKTTEGELLAHAEICVLINSTHS